LIAEFFAQNGGTAGFGDIIGRRSGDLEDLSLESVDLYRYAIISPFPTRRGNLVFIDYADEVIAEISKTMEIPQDKKPRQEIPEIVDRRRLIEPRAYVKLNEQLIRVAPRTRGGRYGSQQRA
jgi:hypothetical protein